MSKRIYISGPISGHPADETQRIFMTAEGELQKQGYKTCNPLRMRLPVWLAHIGCYRMCLLIEMLWMAYTCRTVYMLDGWFESRGAKAEKYFASALHKRILYEKYVPRKKVSQKSRRKI